MKKNIQFFCLFLFVISNGLSQSEFPFFEQSAFDYYRTVIINEIPINKKVTVYKYYFDFQDSNHYFSEGECLEKPVFKNQIRELDQNKYGQDNIDTDKFELDLSNLDKKKFRIRKFKRGRFPKLFISYPMVSTKENQRFFVNIYEKQVGEWNIYHLELNIMGEVVDWCRSKNFTLVIH